MSENHFTSIATAFDILLAEIEAETEAVQTYANQISAFREKVEALREEWKTMEGTQTQRSNLEEASHEERETEEEVPFLQWDGEEASTPQTSIEDETIPTRYPVTSTRTRGSHASRKDYYRPILEALIEFGGGARLSNLLEKLEQTMKGILREADYGPTPNGLEIYWRYAVRRVHQDMLKQGLLKWGSPHGRWEISEFGRQALTERRI
jgi:lysyl-tRNA synthetase class I